MGCCAPEETDATGDLSFEITDLKNEGDLEPLGGSFAVVIRDVISTVHVSQSHCLPMDYSNKTIRFVRMNPDGKMFGTSFEWVCGSAADISNCVSVC